jgi:hypothetical protein
LRLTDPGTPYWQRPDLGIGPEDVTLQGRNVRVKVHSLGSVPAPAAIVVVRNAAGRILAGASVPALAAPVDLRPQTVDVTLTLPAGADPVGGWVEIDPDHALTEITTRNNAAGL